jgi:hypothetical protein
LSALKVEPPIARDHQKVQAIRVYPGRVLKHEIDSSIERGETPSLMVKKEPSKKRGVEEVSLVFMGTYHLEGLGYYTKPPDTWTTWGEIYMTPAQALQLAEKIKQITKAPAGERGQLVLVQNMTIRIRARRTHGRAQGSARRRER